MMNGRDEVFGPKETSPSPPPPPPLGGSAAVPTAGRLSVVVKLRVGVWWTAEVGRAAVVHHGEAHGLGYIVVAHVLAVAAPPPPIDDDVTEQHTTRCCLLLTATACSPADDTHTRAHGHQTAAGIWSNQCDVAAACGSAAAAHRRARNRQPSWARDRFSSTRRVCVCQLVFCCRSCVFRSAIFY